MTARAARTPTGAPTHQCLRNGSATSLAWAAARKQLDAWIDAHPRFLADGTPAVDVPPVAEPGGLPPGWSVLVTLNEDTGTPGTPGAQRARFLVTFAAGVAVIGSQYALWGANQGHARTHKPTLLLAWSCLTGLAAHVFTEDAYADLRPGLTRALVPYYDTTDPAEAAEQVLVALGAEPTLLPAAACNA